MMKYSLMVCVLVSIAGYAYAEQTADNQELDALAHRVVDVFANADEAAYRALLHPECPEPLTDKLAYDLSDKWIKGEGEHRIVDFHDRYDTEMLEFEVAPSPQALEFQYWTINAEGEKIELVTGFPVSQHETGLKILDYPCFKPKGM